MADRETDDDTKLPPIPHPVASIPRPFAIRKGSRAFPKGITSKIFESKKKHYRHLQKQGIECHTIAKAKRRRLRDQLSKNDDNFDLSPYPTLQSSSSEESDEQDSNSEWERETVDFQALAHEHSWWAKENLLRVTPVSAISSLVGWATHDTHDGTTISSNDNEPPSDVDEPADDSTSAQQQEANPLACLPNTPLPPSHLNYLAEKARAVIEEPIHQEKKEWKTHSFLTLVDDERPPAKRPHRCKEWQQWDHDSGDETYQSLKKKRTNHVTLHVPCPIPQKKKSKLDKKKKESDKQQQSSRLYNSLDNSALVAAGMLWEDMITASLMPLARQHVARCRRLEQRKKENESSNDDEVANDGSEEVDPFQEWTLPPEQAIWRLAQEGVKSELPSTLPPTRVSSQFFDRETPVKAMLVSQIGTAEQQKQQAVDDWCRSRALDRAFVSNNMDLYGVCLPRAPSWTAASPQEETVREKEDRYERLWKKRLQAETTLKTAPGKEKETSTPKPKEDDESSSEEEPEQQVDSVAV
jgi:hypothetical protein